MAQTIKAKHKRTGKIVEFTPEQWNKITKVTSSYVRIVPAKKKPSELKEKLAEK